MSKLRANWYCFNNFHIIFCLSVFLFSSHKNLSLVFFYVSKRPQSQAVGGWGVSASRETPAHWWRVCTWLWCVSQCSHVLTQQNTYCICISYWCSSRRILVQQPRRTLVLCWFWMFMYFEDLYLVALIYKLYYSYW